MPVTPDLLKGLNREQRAAVAHRGAPLLVLAGAGSGKTRVITTRAVHLISEGAAPESILGVTFTNKAAHEMRGRIRQALYGDPEAARAVTLCTFHSLGVRVLEEFGHRIGLSRRFTILDAEDQRDVLRAVIEAQELDPNLIPPRSAAERVSVAKNGGEDAKSLAAKARTHQERLLAGLLAGYEAMLGELRALDFDDLLCKPLRLLEEHADVRDALRQRYVHIMVDEYQDTNQVQLRLLRLLAGEGGNLMVVGDDDQSIYGWRGACLDNILEFEQHFPSAVVVRMTQNYRSTGRVLELANAIIGGARRRRPKVLWTADDPGPEIESVICSTPQDEAAMVAMQAHRLFHDEGLPYHDMGILMRTNGQAREFEDALRLAGVPYRLVGGTSFFERREVKDALAYLRLIANRRDEIALRRAIAIPSRGVGAGALARLSESARQHLEPLSAALARADRVTGVTPRAARSAVAFMRDIERFTAEIERGQPLAAVAERLFDEVGLRQALLRGEGGRKAAAASFYLENIAALVQSLADYERTVERPSLVDYLQRISLDANDDEGPEAGRVTLMTLHAAKGLEFMAVFLVGLEEGLLPHLRSVEEVAGDDDEERRLFYVGVTRARQRLVLSRCRRRRRFQRDEMVEPSRFLVELPPGLFVERDRMAPAQEDADEKAAAGFQSLLAVFDE